MNTCELKTEPGLALFTWGKRFNPSSGNRVEPFFLPISTCGHRWLMGSRADRSPLCFCQLCAAVWDMPWTAPMKVGVSLF